MRTDIDSVLPPTFEPFEEREVESSLLARFAKIAARHPSRVAVRDGDMEQTYAQLDRAANSLAGEILQRLGHGAEPVALLYTHGAEYYRAQWGVLKAGKFFASLDSELALERLELLLADLGVRLILCNAGLEKEAKILAGSIPECAVINTETMAESSGDPPDVDVSPDSIACIIYTSGSTGRPEGVVLSHLYTMHYVMHQIRRIRLGREDRSLQLCPLSSLASIGEIFPALLSAGTLLPYRLRKSGMRRLAQWMIEERISICAFVPVMFRLLLSRLPENTTLPDVRLISLSGDRIIRNDCLLYRRHFGDRCLLRVLLGASEAAVYTDLFVHRSRLPAREIVAAGYPLEDMEVFVVGEDLQPLGPGEVGEIAVKSRFLCGGYWKNDKLTAERFLDPPEKDGSKIYLTRDLGCFDEDGCLVHLGRKDSRVKIYGKMVTVSEIEESLLQAPGVREAAVVAVADTADTFLIGYYITNGSSVDADPPPDTGSIRQWLLARFPIEIVPKKLVRLDALPLTSRSKVDRRRLAADWRDYERRSAKSDVH